MSGISLHPELGVNPRMIKIHCIACAKVKDDSLFLLGNKNFKMRCPKCGTWIFGGVPSNKSCPKCDTVRPSRSNWERTELGASEHCEMNGVCSDCLGHMDKGIIMVSVRDGEEERGETRNPYRTGGWVVIKEEVLDRIFNKASDEAVERIRKQRLCFVPDKVWDMIGLPRGDVDSKVVERK